MILIIDSLDYKNSEFVLVKYWLEEIAHKP